MDGSIKIQLHNQALLARYVWQDNLIALCFVATTFSFLPGLALVWPVMSFAFKLLTSSKLDPEIERKLRCEFPIPARTIIRQSDKDDSQVISIPFRTVIFLSEEATSDWQNHDATAEIYHEIGHQGQYDWLIIESLKISFYLWLIICIKSVPDMVFKTHVFYNQAENSEVLYRTGPFWLTVITLLIIITAYTTRRVIHDREMFADTNATILQPQAMLKWLAKQADEEPFKKPKNWLVAGQNRFFHPSMEKRYGVQQIGLTRKPSQIFLNAFIWSLICGLLIVIMVLPNRASFDGAEIDTFLVKSLALFIFVQFFAFFVGKALSINGWLGKRDDIVLNHGKNRLWLAMGYWLGLSTSSTLLFMVGIVLHDSPDMMIEITIMFFLAVGFFLWLLMALTFGSLVHKLHAPAWINGIVSIISLYIVSASFLIVISTIL